MTVTPLERWIADRICAAGPLNVPASLADYQLHMLQLTLDHVREKSLFYRRHLQHVPRTVPRLADVGGLPFTTADDILQGWQQFLCVSQGQIERVVTLQSSGTTGAPKRLCFTAQDMALTVDFFSVGMSILAGPKDRVLILLPGERPGSVGELLGRALQRFGAEPVPHGPVRDPAETLRVMREQDITCIVGIPTQVLWLARLSGGMPLSISSVLLSTDYVPAAIRTAVEKAWDCRVYNHYGMTEMGLGGGVDCAARQGYHLREADIYFEIIDPATGATLPDGETGEVVFTTLTRTGMPLIRYRTGDLSRMLPGACPCGTRLRRMDHIRGRCNQTVMLRNGCRLTLPALDEALFAIDGLLDYRATVIQGAGACRLQLQFKAAPGGRLYLRAEIENALFRAEILQPSFLDGSLKLESVKLCNENRFSDGAAKRTLRILKS